MAMDDENDPEKAYLFQLVKLYREHSDTVRLHGDRLDRAQRHTNTLQMSVYSGLLRNLEEGNIELAKTLLQQLVDRCRENFAKEN
jgi:hypothetical protein